jgi:hypothetical protein
VGWRRGGHQWDAVERGDSQGTLAAGGSSGSRGGAEALGVCLCLLLLLLRAHCPKGWQALEAVGAREGWWIRRGRSSLRRFLFLTQSPSLPSFCLACPIESELAPIPTRTSAHLKALLVVLKLALQVAAMPLQEKVETCLAVCD